MQLILDIEESQKDVILNIIQNLKEGLIKKYTLKPSTVKLHRTKIEAVSPEEEKEIKALLGSMTVEEKQVAHSTKYSVDL